MATTTNLALTPADGWVLVSTNPYAITIKSNSSNGTRFALAVTESGVPTVTGEIHSCESSWESGEIQGEIYIKALDNPHDFAITKQE